jgi:hypothetical protein
MRQDPKAFVIRGPAATIRYLSDCIVKSMTSNDPLLQPFQLKHLTLKNRLMRRAPGQVSR